MSRSSLPARYFSFPWGAFTIDFHLAGVASGFQLPLGSFHVDCDLFGFERMLPLWSLLAVDSRGV
jgi:hypothetical protein